jgi:carboxylate-amine ligase
MTNVFAAYPPSDGDEVVAPTGRLREPYVGLGPALEELGTAGLTAAAEAIAAGRAARGVTLSGWADGRQQVRDFPMDPLPRIVRLSEWAALAAGVEQRHRALNAFLADAYRAAGRRRGDADRAPDIVRAGVLPEWAVAHSPGHDPDAVAMAWPGQPRAAVAASDVLRTGTGAWLVRSDSLQVPWGLGYALANRDSARAAVPELFPAAAPAPVDPWDAVPMLRAGLAAAAPPACTGTPRLAVLTAGDGDSAWFEHRLLAEALGVPLVRSSEIWPRVDGGVEVLADGERTPVDVLYRRFDDAALGAYLTPTGQPVDVLLAEAVRAGRLGLANVPGNGVADDAAAYAFVPAMISFYLGEKPLLDSLHTWVLADPGHWAQVRGRLHELVLEPVAGYGGRGTVVGPACTAAELARLEAEVSAAPHRFVAREPVGCSTVPTLVEGSPQPRAVDLRVFSVAGPVPRALPAPLTQVASGPGPATSSGGGTTTKDTWLLG